MGSDKDGREWMWLAAAVGRKVQQSRHRVRGSIGSGMVLNDTVSIPLRSRNVSVTLGAVSGNW